ncbi:GNAT family N-acetyltransferase [Pseudooceanicola algae]|uniref:Uncharacterized protein n=1 Tax=Pseudooceanicola algae TaxID=1537215 RepID=A0A418SGJ3_9RHOB|nr:GNAT family N-acetyltransferase [Pseudooceanicola algae]QPM91794.1 hypothetical protein PSAL_030490 [Pseudooceanicola algae]
MITQAGDKTARLMDVVDGTWPAAEILRDGPWTLRRGAGGGKRVSAASTDRPVTDAQIDRAEAGLAAWGQPPLFRLTDRDLALDAALAARGYDVIDPVLAYLGTTADLAAQARSPDCGSMAIWKPLAIQQEIWAEGGIGAGRIAVMQRATGPRTTLLGRWRNSPAATAFVATTDGIAMLHALEVSPDLRGKGMGRAMMIDAAAWALQQGAAELSVVCTRANAAGNALYSRLGMALVGGYHYRQKG